MKLRKKNKSRARETFAKFNKKRAYVDHELINESIIKDKILPYLFVSSQLLTPLSSAKLYQYNLDHADRATPIADMYRTMDEKTLFERITKIKTDLDEKIFIKDERPSKPGVFSGYYPKWIIEEIIKECKKQKIDPYLCLAIALAESGIGKSGITNIFQHSDDEINENDLSDVLENVDPKDIEMFEALKEIDKDSYENIKNALVIKKYIKFSISYIKKKLARGKKLAISKGKKDDMEFIIQAYNGYGKIDLTKYIGYKEYVKASEENGIVDMMENPLYGKKVLDLYNYAIRSNKEIIRLAKKYNAENF